jgi:hypothetical protein
MSKAIFGVVLLITVWSGAAQAQQNPRISAPAVTPSSSAAPQRCRDDDLVFCVQDSQATYVGVITKSDVNDTTVAKGFGGLPFLLDTIRLVGIPKGQAAFYYPTNDCSGPPSMAAPMALITFAAADADGNLWAATGAQSTITVHSSCVPQPNGPNNCHATNATPGGACVPNQNYSRLVNAAEEISTTFVQSLVPPLSLIPHIHPEP